MRRIPVLWLVEHIAREMDVTCAVKYLAKARHNLDITVRQIYLHANEVMAEFVPDVVVYPFFYYADGALAQEDYARCWPDAIHFNLAWEELFYKAHEKVKAPSDEFARKKVIHHAWGDFFKTYLMASGVPEDHVFVNGQPAYQLYLPPYSRYYRQRDWLAREYKLDTSKRWVFFPENYRWAFFNDKKLDQMALKGPEVSETRAMRDFCHNSLVEVLRWCQEAARHKDLEIIFRPRPATMEQEIASLFAERIGTPAPNLHLIKGESVREWILASDKTISSYSTSLIEAAIAGKPIYMAEPFPIPQTLCCDWYQHVRRLRTAEEFDHACLSDDGGADGFALASWARGQMLSRGDPIARLADFVKALADRQKHSGANRGSLFWRTTRKRLGSLYRCLMRMKGVKRKNYFNPRTHEKDQFDEKDVRQRVQAWQAVLRDSA